MNNSKVLYSVLFISILLGIVYSFLFISIQFNDWDTPNFINATRALFGYVSDIDFQARITKPFVLLLPGTLYSLFNVSITTSIFIQNWLFWIGTGILFSLWLKNLGYSDKKQILGVFILYTVPPVIIHSFELINDIAGYFFIILQLWLYSEYRKKDTLQLGNYVFLGIVLLLGLLSKESSIIAIVYIVLYEFYSNYRKSLLNIIFTYSITLIFYICIQFVLAEIFSKQTFIQYYSGKLFENNGIEIHVKQIIRAFDFYYFFIIASLVIWFNKKNNQRILIISLLASFLITFLWPLVQDRIVAIIAPYAVALILSSKYNKYVWYLIVTIGIVNIIVNYIVYTYNIAHLLHVYYLIFALIVGLIWINKGLVISE